MNRLTHARQSFPDRGGDMKSQARLAGLLIRAATRERGARCVQIGVPDGGVCLNTGASKSSLFVEKKAFKASWHTASVWENTRDLCRVAPPS